MSLNFNIFLDAQLLFKPILINWVLTFVYIVSLHPFLYSNYMQIVKEKPSKCDNRVDFFTERWMFNYYKRHVKKKWNVIVNEWPHFKKNANYKLKFEMINL